MHGVYSVWSSCLRCQRRQLRAPQPLGSRRDAADGVRRKRSNCEGVLVKWAQGVGKRSCRTSNSMSVAACHVVPLCPSSLASRVRTACVDATGCVVSHAGPHHRQSQGQVAQHVESWNSVSELKHAWMTRSTSTRCSCGFHASIPSRTLTHTHTHTYTHIHTCGFHSAQPVLGRDITLNCFSMNTL